MAGSADVEETTPKPHVMWANIEHFVAGVAGRATIAFTHNGEEGVYDAIAKDLEEAAKAVFLSHGYAL